MYAYREKYFKGTLTFKEKPSISELKFAAEMYRVLGNEIELINLEDIELTTQYAFGMRGLGDAPEWLHSLVRGKSDEEKYEMLFIYRVEDIEKYFSCKVELNEIVPSMANMDDLEIIKTLYRGGLIHLRESEQNGCEGNKLNNTQNDLDASLQELDAMIGLSEVKQQIHNIVKIVKNRGANSLPCMHMVFTGNPGTGKTKIARILACILQALNVLKTDTFIETDRSGLVAKYVGHTALKTKEIIKKAQGGMLFIDEAYSLGCYSDEVGAVNSRRRDFGPEAIDALVKEMEDSDFICIMAGYPREMQTMISCNPGLRDRVGFYIDFPDYSDIELCEIYDYMISDRNYEITDDARNCAYEWLRKVHANNDRDFGNARLVRRFVDRVIFKQNVRAADSRIEVIDVNAAIKDSDLAKLTDNESSSDVNNPIGFAVA